jgi:hypothetical protein
MFGSTLGRWVLLLSVLPLSAIAFAQEDSTTSGSAASAPMPVASSIDAPDSSDTSAQGKPAASGQGKPAADDSDALAKAAQNPVASLISFPLQNNTNFAVGPFNRTQNILNIQPVVPISLSENWNLITRTILPIVWQPNPGQNTQGTFGFGDLNPTFFFSPAKPGKLIWGLGPAFVLPTATNNQLGQGKLSAGPSLVALMTPGHWVVGALTSNVWSVAGSGSRPAVNQFLLQWFVNYNMKKGWYLVTSPIVTADWTEKNGGRWVVPFGGGLGRITKIGPQPVNITAQFYGNAIHPANASPWGMRLQIQLLYPKKPKQA